LFGFVVVIEVVKVDRATHIVAMEYVSVDDPLDHWVLLKRRIGCVKTLVSPIGRIVRDVVETNGRWLPHRTIVEETNLVDCHSVCERNSRSYVSAKAETCQRGAVVQNFRAELSSKWLWRLWSRTGEHSCRAAWLLYAKVAGAASIAVEQRGF
jgi:hypothetical protein